MASKPKSHILAAASALALGATLIGCTPTGGRSINTAARASSSHDITARQAAQAAVGALGRDQMGEGIAQAERAVQFAPRDAGYRSLLANAYLKAGRFVSAQQSFSEVLLLNPSDGRAALSQALTQIALGDRQGALATLQTFGTQIPAADHGLALALAGDPVAALAILEPAAREPDADARLRQNLALAHALAGQWEQAQVVAAQDVPADELSGRLAAWAEFARPDKASGQVPTLLGVAPVQDLGRPERLALIVEPTQAEVAVAQATPVEEPATAVVAVAAPVAAPAVAEVVEAEPVRVAEARPIAAANPVAAMPVLAAAPVVSAVPKVPAVRQTQTVRRAPKPRVMNGRFAVQLGAFSSKARVQQAWNNVVGRHRTLGAYQPSTTAVAARNGTLHRLSVSGFGTQQQAYQLCAQVRRQGGACFVRSVAGDQPIRWAGRQVRHG